MTQPEDITGVSGDELKVLEGLDTIIQRKSVRERIDVIALKAVRKLIEKGTDLLVWEPVPLAIYGEQLPDIIRSSWVFAIHSRASTGAERHPNSRQRMISYQGSGDLQVWNGNKWCSHFLISSPEAPVESRWLSIPENVWHQAVVAGENWLVLSFHTVPENGLIEERPDAADVKLMRQRRYIET